MDPNAPTTADPNNGSIPSSSSTETSANKPPRAENGQLLPGGPSLNPGGRPSVSITAEIRKALLEVFEDESLSNEDKKTALQLVVKQILKNGIVKQDQRALDKIWAYIDGMPKGSLDLGFDKEGLKELTEFMKTMASPPKPKME